MKGRPTLRRNGGTRAPLSFSQERLWFINAAQPNVATYNVPLLMRWNESVNADALIEALSALVKRHEVLRTTYLRDEESLVQVIRPAMPTPVTVIAATTAPSDEDQARYAREPFDLESGPLLRCVLWQGLPEGDISLLVLHHIAVDGWSLAPLFKDFGRAYDAALAGRPAALPELEVQYADYAVWERASFVGSDVEGRAALRSAELRDVSSPLLLAGHAPRERAAEGGRPGGQHTFEVPENVWTKVKDLAARMRATPFVVMFAAYQELLRRWSGSDTFLIGTVMANRLHPALEELVGAFVNTVPFALPA